MTQAQALIEAMNDATAKWNALADKLETPEMKRDRLMQARPTVQPWRMVFKGTTLFDVMWFVGAFVSFLAIGLALTKGLMEVLR